MVSQQEAAREWVLLSYRVPREPSTPRIAIWRRLRALGVAKVGDGLVALPNDVRTKEQLEWVATMVNEADGHAIVWVARTTRRDDEELIATLNSERDDEYEALIADVAAAGPALDGRTLNRLRREWRRVQRRDHFRSPKREAARQAMATLSLPETTPTEDRAAP